MADSTFDALANIPGHMSSFSASAQDGSLVNSTKPSSEREAVAAYQLLADATLVAKATPELQQDKFKRITVTFPNQCHSFTVSNDVIYGIEFKNTQAQQ